MGDFDEDVAGLNRDLLDTFGRPCTFHGVGLPDVSTTPEGGPLLGIFDEHFLLAETSEEDGAEVQTQAVAVWVLLDQLQLPVGRGLEEGDQITVAGKRWGIQEPQRDHVGQGTNLVLFEVPA